MFMTGRPFIPNLNVAVLSIALVLVSCEVSFEPLVDQGLHYTVAGYLDSDSDRQVVRVVPIRPAIDRPTQYDEVPVVTLTDVATGSQSVWVDSTYQLADGSLGLLYHSSETIEAGREYRLTVMGSVGETTADIALPRKPGNPDSVRTIEFPSPNNFPIIWPGVTNVIAVEVYYAFGPAGAAASQSDATSMVDGVVSVYEGEHRGRLVNGSWQFEVRLFEDRTLVSEVREGDVSLQCMVFRIATPSEGWQPPPGGVFDPDVLIQPGLFSNVEGGLGWVGGVSRTTLAWPVINLPENIFEPVQYLPANTEPQVCLDLAREAFNAR